jgi:hypothetical protein
MGSADVAVFVSEARVINDALNAHLQIAGKNGKRPTPLIVFPNRFRSPSCLLLTHYPITGPLSCGSHGIASLLRS